MEQSEKTFFECVGPCVEKIKEHKQIKEFYDKISKGEGEIVSNVLNEKIRDYRNKMRCYLIELIECIKSLRETYENLKNAQQKEQVAQDLHDLESELYCCISEIFELYHYFRTLEDLSDRHVEQALDIPISLICEIMLELRKCP